MKRYITSYQGIKNLRKAFPFEEGKKFDVYKSTSVHFWSVITDDKSIIQWIENRPFPQKPYYKKG